MAGSETKVTVDHDEIRQWIEEHNGHPAAVDQTGDQPGHEPDAGLLRVEFGKRESLDEVDWDAFFRTFDDRELAFLYQARKSDGSDSTFCKFVSRDSVKDDL